MSRVSVGALLFAAAVLLGGCSRPGSAQVAELPITGKVTLDGQPVAGATVMFQSQSTLATFGAVTAADGTYHLQTSEHRVGEYKGPCKVSISKFLKSDGTPLGPNEPPFAGGATESLPRKTSTLETTTLTADVPEGGGTFDFDLKKE
jgi:hypothetical protein